MVLVVCSLARWPVPCLFESSVVLGMKRVVPKLLLEADAPWGGAHKGAKAVRSVAPRSYLGQKNVFSAPDSTW